MEDGEKKEGDSEKFIPKGETEPFCDDNGEEVDVDDYYIALTSKQVRLRTIILEKVQETFSAQEEFTAAQKYIFTNEGKREEMKQKGVLTDEQFDLLDRVIRDGKDDPNYLDTFFDVLVDPTDDEEGDEEDEEI